MKQAQLEAFIDQLAAAEHDAARQIEQAEAESNARLHTLGQRLEAKRRGALKELEAALAAEEQQHEVVLQQQLQCMEKETEAQIDEMRRQHEVIRDALVRWAVKDITQP